MTRPPTDFCRLSLTQLAEAHGRSMRTMRTWTIWGMPRNKDGSYDLSATIEWRARHTTGPDAYVQRAERQRALTLDELNEIADRELAALR